MRLGIEAAPSREGDGGLPVVSVVMATYNRGNIIGYAIRSLLAQSFADWELIVVSDASTDDTAAVVAAFGDARIRYVERATNFGEQSGPNNDGVALARGRYVAYLNHDDLWTPAHLQTQLDALEASGADLVYTVGLAAYRDVETPVLVGATTRRGRYHPAHIAPATLWLFRRELAERIGPWRPAMQLRQTASQDWLQRAWRRGAKIVAVPRITVFLVTSIVYRESYRNRSDAAHARAQRLLADPAFLLDCALRDCFAWEDRRIGAGLWRFLYEWVYALAVQAMLLLRIFPPRPRLWLRNFRKGAMMRRLRRYRGLPPAPSARPPGIP